MKKIIIAGVLFLTALSVSAQKGLNIGIKGMVSNTWILNNEASDEPQFAYLPSMGWQAGVSLGYNFTDNVGIGTELNYATHIQNFSDKDDDNRYRFDLRYMRIPVLFNFASGTDGKAFFSGYVGPSFSIPLQSEFMFTKGILEDADNIDLSEFYKMDIGATLGLGTTINLVDGLYLTLGIRFDVGFTSEVTDEIEDPLNLKAIYFVRGDNFNRGSTINAAGSFEIGVKYALFGNN